MAVASASAAGTSEIIKEPSQPSSMEPSPSRLSSETAYDSSSLPATPDRDDLQTATILRSEEYRQLFRLPPEEVLIEDFNCAFQENILIQGHMYLFVHYICFYSNIFGYETKKMIPFHEVTSVRRAKTAGIFPNAIEIYAGSKKYFFGSFLSRDEAFKLINDGWLQHSNGAKLITDQDSVSVASSQENGVVIEEVTSIIQAVDEVDSNNRKLDISIVQDFVAPSNVEDVAATTTIAELQDIVEQDIVIVPETKSSSSTTSSILKQEDCEAPKIAEGYTMVAESQFPIKVEDFFNYFFSDDAVSFVESFHSNCGDKEFKCNTWYPHDKFGHARDVSFLHPIKLYFGAKFGGCQETQKFRLYKNSHLVIETSQEVSDVPYGDYFHVEGLWDVKRDADESKEGCFLRVYLNVAFSKRTVWKGKIVQSTLEECREAYGTWIKMAHELLKKKNLAKQKEENAVATVVPTSEVPSEREAKHLESSEMINESSEQLRVQNVSDFVAVNRHVNSLCQAKLGGVSSFVSWLTEFMTRMYSSMKTQSNLSLAVAIIFFVILLMQLSILALLARPQHIHVHAPAEYNMGMDSKLGGGRLSSEALIWLEKRMHHLKDEMYMVEARLERMRHEHSFLKSQLENFKPIGEA
ncbi:protein VASCULAR ASSOCIATED DEATH 1, chloroplastic isoform X1 [Cannabis sativa]|uniref:protein VASCULAR ASSOCIATED DEATH 1, chloroplastic isoform X1 n=3 Tax=Cannabis sativa TaxID=3483 RepID=UPI0029CA75B3|nr:protein VASCULAR ASSOCIATED DEATH 1, chloroplastic isoform X1 [Cannabis sativa]